MRLNQEQLDKFTEIFEIKAKSVILVKKNKKVTIIMVLQFLVWSKI